MAQQREKAEVVKDFVGMDYKGAADFDYAAAEKRMMPLNALTPFAGSQWLVKARVVDKQPVRRWRNAKGTGLVTNITIIDACGTAVRVTLFNDGVEKFYRMLQPGKAFIFGPTTRPGCVRPANKQFSSVQHDYEITLDETATVQPVQGGDGAAAAIPTKMTATFVRLSELAHRQPGSMADVRAIVLSASALSDVVQKSTGRQLKRRVVQVCDPSGSEGTQCDVTLWEEAARSVPATARNGLPVLLRGVRVHHWQGTQKVTSSRDAEIEWDAEGCKDLSDWWTSQGKAAAAKGRMVNVSQRIDDGNKPSTFSGGFRLGLSAIAAQEMGRGERPDWINVRCTVMGIPDRALWYDACPTMVPDSMAESGKRPCAKKIENFVPGSKVHCQKCDCDIDHVLPRYIAGVKIADHTSELWATLFDDIGAEFFGVPASVLKEKPDLVDTLRQQLQGTQATLTLKVKEEVTPDGQTRTKAVAARVRHLRRAGDWAMDCRNLLQDLDRYQAGDAAATVQLP